MSNKGGSNLATSGVKGAGVLAIFGISYINHIFSPLIWGLLILIIIDVILNVHKEGQQLNKIGSAFATLSGTSLMSFEHALSPEAIHGIVAVMVLAYIQVVAPQIVNIVTNFKFISPNAKADLIAALKEENAALKQKAITQAKTNKVIITSSNGESK